MMSRARPRASQTRTRERLRCVLQRHNISFCLWKKLPKTLLIIWEKGTFSHLGGFLDLGTKMSAYQMRMAPRMQNRATVPDDEIRRWKPL